MSGVIIEKLLDAVQDYVDWNTIGMATIDVFNAVLDEVWSVDAPCLRKRPEPFFQTQAGKSVYPFVDLLAFAPDIRKLRGVYRHALSPVNDYGYTATGDDDQLDPLKRRFDDDWIINPIRKTLTYAPMGIVTDPGTTTDIWRLDYYESAPSFTENETAEYIPVLSNEWVWKMLQPGMIAYYEDSKHGKPGANRTVFDAKKAEYQQILINLMPTRLQSTERGIINRSVVIPL